MFNKYIEKKQNHYEETRHYNNVPLPLNRQNHHQYNNENSIIYNYNDVNYSTLEDNSTKLSITPEKSNVMQHEQTNLNCSNHMNSLLSLNGQETMNQPQHIKSNNIIATTNVDLYDLKEQINIAIDKTNSRIDDVLKLLDDELNNLYTNVDELKNKQLVHEQLIQHLANEIMLLRNENKEKNILHKDWVVSIET